MSWNVRSLIGKMNEFRLIVKESKPDVICLQEIWAIPKNVDLSLQGYNPPLQQQRGSRGGGVMLYVGSHIPFRNLNTPFIAKHLETIGCEITLQRNKYCILNVYTGQKNKTDIVNDLSKLVEQHKKTYKGKVITAGDFNINLLKLGQDPDADYLFDKMSSNGFVPLCNFPTRQIDVAGIWQTSAIDNFFCKPSLHASSFALANNDSDHYPIYMEWGKARRPEKTKLTIRPVDEFKLAQLEFALLHETWSSVYDANDADAAALEFERIKDLHINKHLPQKTITIRPDRIKSWFTLGLQKSRRTLQTLNKAKTRSDQARKEFRAFKLCYKKTCRRAEQLWTQKELEANISNTRRTWKILDDVVNRKRKGGELSGLFKVNGVITNDKARIAAAFNEQYVNMGSNLAKKFQGEPNFQKYLDYKKQEFDFKTVSPGEVHDTILAMDNKTSHGHDALTNQLLKKFNTYLYKPLTSVINKSIAQSVFPEVWKISRVIPLYKADDVTNMLNYRPVSLCPVASKIMEKVVHKQVYSYVTEKGLIPSTQYGFQKKNQTQHLIAKFLNIVTNALQNKKKVMVTFLDFSKAFDTVPHRPFLEKLFSMGFTVRTVHWFESYLCGREQYVDFKGIFSGTLPIVCGVPQGTCLGPLIFLLYTADLNGYLRHSFLLSFADDTTVITIADSIEQLNKKISKDFEILTDWYKHSRLSLNVKKTEYMLFFSDNGKLAPILQGEKIKQTSAYKLVGLLIDDKLAWDQHLEKVVTKLRQTIGMLARAKHTLPQQCKLLVYHSLFRSYLTYGLAHYGALLESQKKKLQMLQNRALRIVFGEKRTENIKKHREKYKLLTVEDEIILSRIQLGASVADPTAPRNIKLLYQKTEAARITRQAKKTMFEQPKWKKESLRRSSTYAVPYLYNNLHETVQKLKIKQISRHVKRSLLGLNNIH